LPQAAARSGEGGGVPAADGVRCLPKHAKEIVLDLDSMGHLVHGLQEGRHFSGYYGTIAICRCTLWWEMWCCGTIAHQ